MLPILLLLANCFHITAHDAWPRRTTDCPTFRTGTATATTIEETALGIAPSVVAQKISSDDAMSRTKQSWNCSDQRMRAGIAHGMLRLHIGDCHVRVLIDDDDFITRITIWRVVLPQ